jgi:threonine/homoserine/homoserine lactone efflux protein
MMLLGVGIVLVSVASVAVLARTGLGTSLSRVVSSVSVISRLALGLAGLVLIVIALIAILENR